MKDKIFHKEDNIKQFEFDESVASVFDDMLLRSVPFYEEVMKLSISILHNELDDGDVVVDLGSSTASFLLALENSLENKNIRFIGIDNAKAMIEQAQKKAQAYGSNIEFILDDIFNFYLDNISVVSSFYTLQFIRPLQREKLIKKIYQSLKSGGIFIFSEKLITSHKKLDKQMIDIYYNHKKKQGYSDLEITRKREALENVLVPYTEDENKKMVLDAGFLHVETLFRWNNFALFIAYKV